MKLNIRKNAKILLLLVVLALLAMSCAQDEVTDTTGDGVGDTTDTETEDGATTTAAPTPGDDGEDGADEGEQKSTIVVSLDTDVNTLEPMTLRSTGAFAATGGLYDGLLRERLEEGPDGILLSTKEFEPNLAESWEQTQTNNGVEVVFGLRDGIQFANGDPIVAEDFVWTGRRALNSFLLTQMSLFGLDEEPDFEARDENTLVLTPDSTGPVFEQLMSHQHLSTALNMDAIMENATDEDPWAFDWLAENPTPNGPYVLGEFDRESQVVLTPNPNYWDSSFPRNGGVTIRFVPDGEQRALLVQRGELDLANGIPSRILADLENSSDVSVYQSPSSRLHYLGMNTQRPPFDNVDVRRAISYAVPYQDIVDTVLFGFGNTAGGFVSRNMVTYAGDEIGTYEKDLDRAQQLLEDSGVGPFSIELAVRQSRAEEQEAAVLIQDSLRQIGVNVEVAVLPDGEFFERLNAKELPFWIHDWYQWGEDPFLLMAFLVRSGAFTNYALFENEELDNLIQEGLVEGDPDRRAEISRRAQEILLDNAPMAYLYNKDWHAVASPDLTGINKDMTEVPKLEYLSKDDS